jgi:hypothetical protein
LVVGGHHFLTLRFQQNHLWSVFLYILLYTYSIVYYQC